MFGSQLKHFLNIVFVAHVYLFHKGHGVYFWAVHFVRKMFTFVVILFELRKTRLTCTELLSEVKF